MSKGAWTPQETVVRIKELAVAGKDIGEIHRLTGANSTTICCILTGRHHRDVRVPGDEVLAKGRRKRGTAHHEAKLTDELVREILARAAALETNRSIAQDPRINVSEATICNIVSGKAWKHVPRAAIWNDRRLSGETRSKRWSRTYPEIKQEVA
jgi:hypothetical protein